MRLFVLDASAWLFFYFRLRRFWDLLPTLDMSIVSRLYFSPAVLPFIGIHFCEVLATNVHIFWYTVQYFGLSSQT